MAEQLSGGPIVEMAAECQWKRHHYVPVTYLKLQKIRDDEAQEMSKAH